MKRDVLFVLFGSLLALVVSCGSPSGPQAQSVPPTPTNFPPTLPILSTATRTAPSTAMPPSPAQATPRPTNTPRPGTPTPRPTPVPPTNEEKTVANATNQFGFQVLGEIVKRDGLKNTFISPLSLSTDLAMLWHGAACDTQAQMSEALSLSGASETAIAQGNAQLLTRLTRPDDTFALSIANSLWLRRGYGLKSAFIQRARDSYRAEVAEIEFVDPAATQAINGWVSRQTKGKIPTLIDRVNRDDMLYLLNAVYFKGAWLKPFDRASTQDAPFTLVNGQQKTAPMMRQGGMFGYTTGGGVQVARLPYLDQRTSMILILPDKDVTLQDTLAKLTPTQWQAWLNDLKPRQGAIGLPRFKFDYSVDLAEPLKALGMTDAFDPNRADFGALTNTRVYVNLVKQKTFVEVNEEGTEAAAATAIGIAVASAPVSPFTMILDRPFIAAIQDEETGALLFLGLITEP